MESAAGKRATDWFEGPLGTRVLREDRENEVLLYLGTEFGVWASVDRGASWTRINNNLPTVAVHELAQATTASRRQGSLAPRIPSGGMGRPRPVLLAQPRGRDQREPRRAARLQERRFAEAPKLVDAPLHRPVGEPHR